MPRVEVRRLDPSECEALARALGDAPETVIASRQLRHGLCEAHVEAGSGRHDAVVLRLCRPSDDLARATGSLIPAPPSSPWRGNPGS